MHSDMVAIYNSMIIALSKKSTKQIKPHPCIDGCGFILVFVLYLY